MKYIGTKDIETKRLHLRKIKIEDADIAYKNWCNSNVVDRYVLWTKHQSIDVTRNQYEKWIKEYDNLKTFRWIVEIKETKELIGTIDVSKSLINYGTCEIGYCYGEKYWNHGYGTEALKAVIKYLFEECDADLIYAEHLEHNPASGKVMEKAGLKYETNLRSRIIDKNGKRNDLIVYSLTKEEYVKSRRNT